MWNISQNTICEFYSHSVRLKDVIWSKVLKNMSKRNTLFHKLLLFWTIFQLQNQIWIFKGILWSQNIIYNTFRGHWLLFSLFYVFLWPNCKIFRKNISHVKISRITVSLEREGYNVKFFLQSTYLTLISQCILTLNSK